MAFLKGIFRDGESARLRAGWRLVLQFALLLAFLTIFVILERSLYGSLPRGPVDARMSILFPFTMMLSHLASVWIAGRFLDRRRFADFGFRFSRSWWADFAFGLALGALLITAIFLIEAGAGWARVTETLPARGDGGSFLIAVLATLAVLVTVGVSEETLSRGYLLRNLAEGLCFRSAGPQGAVVLAAVCTSIVFGLGHVTNPGATALSTWALVLGGLLYATAYVLTGQLAVPIGFHITWNFFQGSVFGFPVSGHNLDASFVDLRVEGPALWTGGEFGPEAGLLGMAARVAGILLIIAWVRLRYRRLDLREDLAVPVLRERGRS